MNYKIFNNNCNGSSLEAYPCFPPVTQIASHVLLNGNCRRLIRRADLSFQNFIKLSTVLSRIICSYISHKVKVLLPLWGWVIHLSIMTFWWHFSWILTKWLKSESLGAKRWYGDALSGLLIPSLCFGFLSIDAIDKTRWSCPWNSDQNYTQNSARGWWGPGGWVGLWVGGGGDPGSGGVQGVGA